MCVHWVNLGVETKRMLLRIVFSGKSRKKQGRAKKESISSYPILLER